MFKWKKKKRKIELKIKIEGKMVSMQRVKTNGKNGARGVNIGIQWGV